MDTAIKYSNLRRSHSPHKTHTIYTNMYIDWLTYKKPTSCYFLILFYILESQHISGINVPIFRSFRLCC